jgi:hypothetical protein
VLKVTGIAQDCRKSVEGTGFVYAAERVMTNAHVVAGVDAPKVEVGDRQLDATVVLFDPAPTWPCSRCPGLERAALPFAGQPRSGADAIVVGYPRTGPFDVRAGPRAQHAPARGQDIYGRRRSTAQIYACGRWCGRGTPAGRWSTRRAGCSA